MEYTERELATEEWRDIAGYEGKYQISNLGRVLLLGVYRDGRRPYAYGYKWRYKYE